MSGTLRSVLYVPWDIPHAMARAVYEYTLEEYNLGFATAVGILYYSLLKEPLFTLMKNEEETSLGTLAALRCVSNASMQPVVTIDALRTIPTHHKLLCSLHRQSASDTRMAISKLNESIID